MTDLQTVFDHVTELTTNELHALKAFAQGKTLNHSYRNTETFLATISDEWEQDLYNLELLEEELDEARDEAREEVTMRRAMYDDWLDKIEKAEQKARDADNEAYRLRNLVRELTDKVTKLEAKAGEA